MAVPSNFDLESPSWLRNLRWAGVIGMAAAVVGAMFLGVDFASTKIFVVLGLLAFWNLVLPLVEMRFSGTTRAFVFLQLVVDILFLSVVLWWSGGLVNPLAGFLILHVLIAGLMLNSFLTVAASVIACVSVLVLIRAPGLVIRGEEVSLFSSPVWFGVPIGLVLMIVFTTAFLLVFLNRLTQAQDQLRQRIKMDALGRLVAGLAHEIGTPLNSILLIAKELEESGAEEQKKEMSIIASQAKRCGEIVSLLLGYSQTFVRRSEDVKYTPVQLVPWIEETYRVLTDGEAKRYPDRYKDRPPVAFKIDARGVPDTLSIPQLILRQVVENLLKNARDALAATVQPRILVEVSIDPEENELVIVISDNGPGFSKEEAEKAFEAFFSTKKQGFGSGLGLYISYYLLSQVGGRIAIEEGNGPGARMLVAIPRLDGLDEEQES